MSVHRTAGSRDELLFPRYRAAMWGHPHEDAPTRVTLFLLYFLAVSELDHEILMTAARQPAPERHARFATAHRENECAVIALSSFS